MSERGEKYRHVSLKTPKDVILKCLVLFEDIRFTVLKPKEYMVNIHNLYCFFKLNIQTAFYVIISVDFQVTNSSNLTHKTNYSMSIMCKSFFSFFFTYAYNLQPGESV